MKKRNIYFLGTAIVTLLLSACSAPASKNEDTTQAETRQEPVHETSFLPETADANRIQELFSSITSRDRASGSQGETDTAEELEQYFAQLGYETELQTFTQKPGTEEGVTIQGTNVIAVKKAGIDSESADILVISAHHDGKPGIQAAIDNASGVAVMLETARLVGDLETDTELRFISFAGEENGRVGSRYYVESLPDLEKDRIIGDIQLDEIGDIHSEELKLSTADGKETLLSAMLSQTAAKKIPLEKELLSDHHSFFAQGIPAVMLSQDIFPFENHSIQDKKTLLDPEKGAVAAQLVANTTAQIMGDITGSFKSEVYPSGTRKTGYPIQRDTLIYFGTDRSFVENMLGISGVLTKEETNDYGDKVETYSYPLRWFGKDVAVDTTFEYRNGYLETIEVPSSDAIGATIEDAKNTIAAFMGEPVSYDGTLGSEYGWEDFDYLKFISLVPAKTEAYQIMIMPYSNGRTIISSYDLSQGWDALAPQSDNDKKLLTMMEQIFYPEDLPLIQLDTFSDGKGNVTGFATALEGGDNSRMQYGLDPLDILDADGNFIAYNKTVKTAVHEYGHLLTLNKGQVDISKQDPSMPSVLFEKETFTKDAYIPAFYESFWKDKDVKSGLEEYRSHPQNFVTAYGATDLAEDIAESFALFVLSDKPETADTVAEKKILFFYDYEDLLLRRDFIRDKLGLDFS